MKYIFPSSQLAQGVFATTLQFCEWFNIHYPAPYGHLYQPLSLQQCQSLIVAMIDDVVAERLIWNRQPRDKMDRLLKAHWPFWDAMSENEFSDQYFTGVLDDVQITIGEWIDRVMPEQRTWNIWYISALNADVILERGDDFRVVDWMRRMKSGEWRYGA